MNKYILNKYILNKYILNKYILFIIFLISFGFYNFSYGLEFKSGDSNDFINTYLSLKLDTSSNDNINVKIYDSYSTEYTGGKRISIKQSNLTGTGILKSKQFGDFYIQLGTTLELSKDDDLKSNCNNNTTYDIVGELYSEYWGNLYIQTGTYYCPLSGDFNINLLSFSLGVVNISNEGGVLVFETDDARGITDDLVESSMIFEDRKVYVSGLISSDNVSGTDSELTDTSFNQLTSGVDGQNMDLKKVINKNISLITRGIESIKTNDTLSNLNNKKIYYYNFSGLEEDDSSNLNNKGKILKLGNGGLSSDYSKIGVSGDRTLIIEGGNLYINADIYNTNNNSTLTIVVKRDSSNKKNGGNVYINPKVTNIDAVIISEGSLLSYDTSNNVINAETHTNALRRQLLIYGMVATKNTIGDDNAPYGSDKYIKDGKNIQDKNYNLAYLRSFQSILNDDVEGDCEGSDNIVGSDGNGNALTYSLAGKKECSITDNPSEGLRSTNIGSPLVIEYNPIIQNNTPNILKK